MNNNFQKDNEDFGGRDGFDREAKWAVVVSVILVSISLAAVLTFLGVIIWAIIRVVGALT